MPTNSIIFGLILIAIGIGGYIHGVTNDKASMTALIPAFFGIVMVVLGLAARASEGMRKHLMHGAVAFALLGFLLTAGRVLSQIANISFNAAAVSQTSLAVVCLVFVLLRVRSIMTARKDRSGICG